MVDTAAVLPDRRQVTADWLERTLRAAGVLDAGRVASLEVEVWRSKQFSQILRLRPTYAGQTEPEPPASFVLKLSNPGQASARAARRSWKETRFYGFVVAAMVNPPVPRCFAVAHDPDFGRSQLLLADLTESHDRPPHPLPPSPLQAEQDIDCLAALHAGWWEDPQLRRAIELRDERWYAGRSRLAERTLARFVDDCGDYLSRGTRSALDQVVAAYPALLRRQSAGAVTVAHGDAHCWNFLTPHDPRSGPACLVDWECWDIEPATNDLATLIAVHWYPDMRAERERALLKRYHRALQARGVAGYDWTRCWDDYRLSVARRVLSPLFQWNRGRPAASWWPNLARVTLAYHDLDCGDMIG